MRRRRNCDFEFAEFFSSIRYCHKVIFVHDESIVMLIYKRNEYRLSLNIEQALYASEAYPRNTRSRQHRWMQWEVAQVVALQLHRSLLVFPQTLLVEHQRL